MNKPSSHPHHQNNTHLDPPDSFETSLITLSEAEILGRFPFLEKYRELLGPLSAERIIGEGKNAIIIRHPNYEDRVLKIQKEESGKPEKESVEREYFVQKHLHKLLAKAKDSGIIASTCLVPFVHGRKKV
jgi:hypothetical protein